VDGELTCLAECGRPVGVVHVRGVLSAATAPALRSAVHECLVDQPNAVVVDLSAISADLSAISVDLDGTVGLLAALARGAVASAGPSLVLCAPPSQLCDRLGESAIMRHLSVHTNLSDALAHANRTGPVRRVQRRLAAGLAASEAARDLVGQACLRWGMLDIADRATTVVTELVANAILHAATDLVVTVADQRQYLHIAVHDGSSHPPRLGGRADSEGLGGAGLLVVDALAAAWGFVPGRTGKTVWATVQGPA
jgi:anti-anti-sigma regulatory factor/anti-sigma regulatory factor (Ser/Thr protein kinase)